jgi:hypothetical protein
VRRGSMPQTSSSGGRPSPQLRRRSRHRRPITTRNSPTGDAIAGLKGIALLTSTMLISKTSGPEGPTVQSRSHESVASFYRAGCRTRTRILRPPTRARTTDLTALGSPRRIARLVGLTSATGRA